MEEINQLCYQHLLKKDIRISIIPFSIGEIVTCTLIGYDYIVYDPNDSAAYKQLLRLIDFEDQEDGVDLWIQDCYRKGFNDSRFLLTAIIHVLENNKCYKLLSFGFKSKPQKYRVTENIYDGEKYPDYKALELLIDNKNKTMAQTKNDLLNSLIGKRIKIDFGGLVDGVFKGTDLKASIKPQDGLLYYEIITEITDMLKVERYSLDSKLISVDYYEINLIGHISGKLIQ